MAVGVAVVVAVVLAGVAVVVRSLPPGALEGIRSPLLGVEDKMPSLIVFK